jgi:hypothetical protein
MEITDGSNTLTPVTQNDLTNNEILAALTERDSKLTAYVNTKKENYPDLVQRTGETLDDFQESVNLASEYCQKYPELVPFQEAIINEAMQALIESHINDDQQINDRQAIEKGIKRFQKN